VLPVLFGNGRPSGYFEAKAFIFLHAFTLRLLLFPVGFFLTLRPYQITVLARSGNRRLVGRDAGIDQFVVAALRALLTLAQRGEVGECLPPLEPLAASIFTGDGIVEIMLQPKGLSRM
jgi:hypothetical protein